MPLSRKQKATLICILAASTLLAYATTPQTQPTTSNSANIAVAPITQKHSKTYTKIKIGDGPIANVEVDTGSSMLVLEEKYLKNYKATDKTMQISYGGGQQVVYGSIVYADVTFDTNPKLIAKQVPIVMVPNGTFKGSSGILGLEMDNQVSARVYFPYPYNQMMVIDGPRKTLIFGLLSDDQIKGFAYYRLKQKMSCNNHVQPAQQYASYPCWETRKVPVTYTFTTPDGNVLYQGKYNTLFDSGGFATHFDISPVPQELKQYTSNGIFKGKIETATIKTQNKGLLQIPTTSLIKMSDKGSQMVNSGHEVFYNKSVLFDAKHGIIGFKD